MAEFQFYSDASHGWLRVSAFDLADVGLTDADISGYSYKRAPTIYFLEEDCDMPRFIEAWKKTHDRELIIVEMDQMTNRYRLGNRLDYLRQRSEKQ